MYSQSGELSLFTGSLIFSFIKSFGNNPLLYVYLSVIFCRQDTKNKQDFSFKLLVSM